MSISAALRAARDLSASETIGRGATIATLALLERLMAPAVVYLLVTEGPFRALGLGLLLSGFLTLRGALERSFAARDQAALYRRVVQAVVGGDVLQPSLLPDEEARGSVFEGVHRIARLLAETLPNLAANLVAALILAVVVAASQPYHVTLLAALTLAVGGAGLFVSRRWVERAQTEAWRAWDHVAEGITDACEARLELVASGRERDFLDRFAVTTRAWDERARRAARIAGVLGRLPMALLAAAVGAAVVVDAWRHGVPWSDASVRAGLLASNAPAFVGIARGLQELVSNEQRLRLIARVVHGERPGSDGLVPPPESPSRVEWSAVHFAYGVGEPEALRGVSFAWQRGELLALAGTNGSGKSTCLRVLLGLGAVKAGDLRVDGVALGQLDAVRWRRTIAFLPQRTYLPPRATIRECLSFLDDDVRDEASLQALDRVGMLPNLRRASPDPLEVRAGTLSAGERQRVALARLLCRPAPLVLLDEPDANMDRAGVQLVAELLVELSRERMVLVVAHTPEVLAIADRVITLENGQLRSDVPRGTH